jgi:hypothetical protein
MDWHDEDHFTVPIAWIPSTPCLRILKFPKQPSYEEALRNGLPANRARLRYVSRATREAEIEVGSCPGTAPVAVAKRHRRIITQTLEEFMTAGRPEALATSRAGGCGLYYL